LTVAPEKARSKALHGVCPEALLAAWIELVPHATDSSMIDTL